MRNSGSSEQRVMQLGDVEMLVYSEVYDDDDRMHTQFSLRGPMVNVTATQLRQAVIDHVFNNTVDEVLIDLWEAPFIDGTGLQVLRTVKQYCQENNVDFGLAMHDKMRHLFDIGGVLHEFEIVEVER